MPIIVIITRSILKNIGFIENNDKNRVICENMTKIEWMVKLL